MAHLAAFVTNIEVLSGGVLSISGMAKVSTELPNDPGIAWIVSADWNWTDIELDEAIVSAAVAAATTAGHVIGATDTKRVFAGCK